MEREKFMQEARLTVHRILEGKENGAIYKADGYFYKDVAERLGLEPKEG